MRSPSSPAGKPALRDLVVLALSLSYIPVRQIAYSLLTVFLSGQLIGLVQKIPVSQTASDKAEIRE